MLLEHDHTIRAGAMQGIAVFQDGAFGGWKESGDEVDKRGFAAAARASHGKEFASSHGQLGYVQASSCPRPDGPGNDLRTPARCRMSAFMAHLPAFDGTAFKGQKDEAFKAQSDEGDDNDADEGGTHSPWSSGTG